MPAVEQSVDVNVAVSTAYDQWARFESYPEWMEGVASVERNGDTHLHWVAKVKSEVAEVENETREWDARIVEQTRDRRLSWESIRGNARREAECGGSHVRASRRVVVPRHLSHGVGTRGRARGE